MERWLRTRRFMRPQLAGCFCRSLSQPLPAFALDKLRISYASVTGNTAGITYIAQRAGLFEKQGLDVELILITGGPASISALLNADVDLDMRAPVACCRHGRWRQADFLAFPIEYPRIRRGDADRRSKTSSSSKVKKSASSASAAFPNSWCATYFKRSAWMRDKDIAIIQVGQARFVAMEKGAIDATVLASAESAYARRNGFRVLDMPALPFFGSTIVSTPGIAAKRSDVMTRYMRGYLDGVRFFLSEPERSRQYLGESVAH